MPALTLYDIQKIESAAKYIFNSSRTTADLNSVANIEQFNNIFALCESMPEYNNSAYSNADKVYLIFYLYVASDVTEGASFEQELNVYKRRNLLFLKNQAVLMEGLLHRMIKISDNIATYVKALIIVEHVNKLIVKKEIKALDAIDDVEDFGEKIAQYENRIAMLNRELTNALAHFGNISNRKSVYLSACFSLLEIAKQMLDEKICDYASVLDGSITQKLGLNSNLVVKKSHLESMKMDLMRHLTEINLSPKVHHIYEVICSYIEVCQLIYLSRYSCRKDVAENAFHLYSLLNNLMLSTDGVILDVLKIRDKCRHIADKLFNPLGANKERQKTDTSNLDRCRVAIESNENAEFTIRLFRFPSPGSRLSATCLWDSVEPGNIIADIKSYIDTMNFFQDYISPERLLFVLKTKLKAQINYVSLLSHDEFNKYHKLMAKDLVGKSYNSHLYPHRAIIQEYDAKLIEHLAHEEHRRRGMRNCMQPY